MKMRDHSIDIETLSSHANAAIIAIGCQEFDLESGKLGRKLYRKIILASAIKTGHVEGSTLQWWLIQSQQARDETFGTDEREVDKFPLAVALDELSTFLRTTSGSVPRMWARGAHFDIASLEWNYRHGAVGLMPPWHHRNVHDLRTLLELAQSLTGFDEHTIEFEGTKHNAQHDATHQAKVAIAAYQALRDATGGNKVKLKMPEPPDESKGFRYWSHPESDSMVKLPFDELPGDPLCVEVDEATFKAWDDEQL